jgi:hypothetical protein
MMAQSQENSMDATETQPEPYKGPKAILFTHVAMTTTKARALSESPNARTAFLQSHEPFFRACFDCTNVGVVYIYVDLVLRGLEMSSVAGKPAFSVPGDLLSYANVVQNLLAQIRDRARISAEAAGRDTRGLPDDRFVVIGISELAHLLNDFLEIDPLLVEPIAGPNGIFTYDSPKFVEAVIRLARGAEPAVGRQPILRIDNDVKPNDRAINAILLSAQSQMRQLRKYYFFSGGYRGEESPDPKNEHAVRVHWFALDKVGYASFLGDLGELGATQLTTDTDWNFPLTSGGLIPRSTEGQLLAAKRGAPRTDRWSPQVISGAGLTMSFACILELPPFLNIPHMVVWIDDHLKRRLHEQLGHIGTAEIEALSEARFIQDREDDPDPAAGKKWAFEVYFERLFRGCLMHALIVAPDGTPGELAKLVDLAVRGHILIDKPVRTEQEYAIRNGQPRLFDRTGEVDCTENSLTGIFFVKAKEQGERVLNVWRVSRYAYDDALLAEWGTKPVVRRLQQGKETTVLLNVEELYQSVAEDAYRYLLLVAEWWDYVRAIMRLTDEMAHWLFIRPV